MIKTVARQVQAPQAETRQVATRLSLGEEHRDNRSDVLLLVVARAHPGVGVAVDQPRGGPEPEELAVEDNWGELLVLGRVLRELVELDGAQAPQVQLQAESSEKSDKEPGLEGREPLGLARSMLDGHAAEDVRVVTRPDLWAVVEHASVESAASS
eukprot:768555-Hanusia_phi.AAC.4